MGSSHPEKRTRLIKLAQHRHTRHEYKFGIKIPINVENALDIDKENGNHLWEEAILKEMNAIRIAFEIKHDGKKITTWVQLRWLNVDLGHQDRLPEEGSHGSKERSDGTTIIHDILLVCFQGKR